MFESSCFNLCCLVFILMLQAFREEEVTDMMDAEIETKVCVGSQNLLLAWDKIQFASDPVPVAWCWEIERDSKKNAMPRPKVLLPLQTVADDASVGLSCPSRTQASSSENSVALPLQAVGVFDDDDDEDNGDYHCSGSESESEGSDDSVLQAANVQKKRRRLRRGDIDPGPKSLRGKYRVGMKHLYSDAEDF